MKIGIPVAAYHSGNPAEFLCNSFSKMPGVTAEVLSQWQFYDSLKASEHDKYICVDSGGALDLASEHIRGMSLKNVAFWYIDFRHNKFRREPTDVQNCNELWTRGGWVFQSQFEDLIDCLMNFHAVNVSWLPLAADTDVWRPYNVPKAYGIGFVGHVWDNTRLRILQAIESSGIRSLITTPGTVWKESAAAALSGCRVGFNVSSFYDTSYAYDVNMRVFETLACGIPLVTNDVPGLRKVFGEVPFIMTYKSEADIIPTLRRALTDDTFIQSGEQAREFIVQHHTYDRRAEMIMNSVWFEGN